MSAVRVGPQREAPIGLRCYRAATKDLQGNRARACAMRMIMMITIMMMIMMMVMDGWMDGWMDDAEDDEEEDENDDDDGGGGDDDDDPPRAPLGGQGGPGASVAITPLRRI